MDAEELQSEAVAASTANGAGEDSAIALSSETTGDAAENVLRPQEPLADAGTPMDIDEIPDKMARQTSVFFVALSFKGQAYRVPVAPSERVESIFEFVEEVLSLNRDHCKIIWRGKNLTVEALVGDVKPALGEGAKLMLVGSTEDAIRRVRSARSDPLVKGFAAEEEDARRRRKRIKAARLKGSAWGTKMDLEYCFTKIQPEFKYHTPTPYEAEALLRKLAEDPGIISIMKEHRFKVGLLTEMSPQEAKERMMNEGKGDMDLLGYNQNYGEKIVLKLRTDNVQGFRAYHCLVNTLVHELTHNIFGPHDDKFWNLFGQLKSEYMKFHEFWSRNGKSAGGGVERFDGFESDDSDADGGILGGGEEGAAPLTDAQRREHAVRMAALRAGMAAAEQEPGACQPGPSGCSCGLANGVPGLQKHAATCTLCSAPEDGTPPTTTNAGDGYPEVARPDDIGRLPSVASASSAVPEPGALTAMDGADPSTGAVDVRGAAPGALGEQLAPSDAATPGEHSGLCDIGTTDGGASSMGEPGAQEGDLAEREPPEEANAAEVSSCSPDAVPPAITPPPAPMGSSPAEEKGLLEDLSGWGLDGAFLWMQKFRSQLEKLVGAEAGRVAAETILKLVRNVVENPEDPKYRQFRRSNPHLATKVLRIQDCVEMLQSLGFELEPGQDRYSLSNGRYDGGKLRMAKELLEQKLQAVS